jgi:hypothetical protein
LLKRDLIKKQEEEELKSRAFASEGLTASPKRNL